MLRPSNVSNATHISTSLRVGMEMKDMREEVRDKQGKSKKVKQRDDSLGK